MPLRKELKREQEAQLALEANISPRYRELRTLEAYIEGTQYAGMPNWFDDEAPLLTRAPLIVEPIFENAIESFGDFLFGESRFPTVTAKAHENELPFQDAFAFKDDEIKEIDALIKAAFAQADVCSAVRETVQRAMSQRTGVLIAGVVDGALRLELESAKCCYPVIDSKRPSVIRVLEIRYPYLDKYWDSELKSWALRCLWYRRVIDETRDTTYLPLKVDPSGEDPQAGDWIVDTEHVHGFGFCPVVWYAFKRSKSTRKDADGVAIHERLLDEADALNRTLSQRHRAGLYTGDPQIVETGVMPGEDPGNGGEGATPVPSISMGASIVESNEVRAANAKWVTSGGGQGSGRKKGPGNIWTYRQTAAKVEYLQPKSDAFKPLDEEAELLREIISEALSWTRANALKNSNSGVKITNITAKALTWIYQRQTSECDNLRPEVWNGLLYPLTDLLLRIILHFARNKGGLYLAGVDKAEKLLARFEVDIKDNEGKSVGKRWFRPMLRPIWPPYFTKTEADEKLDSDQVKQDFETGLITKETAVRKLAAKYQDITNIEEYLEQLEAECEERRQQEAEGRIDEFGAMHKIVGANAGAGKSGTGGGPKPPKPSSS